MQTYCCGIKVANLNLDMAERELSCGDEDPPLRRNAGELWCRGEACWRRLCREGDAKATGSAKCGVI